MSDLVQRLEALAGTCSELSLPGGPIPRVEPPDEEAVAELLRLAARDGLVVLPVGAGTKLDWCHPAERVDFALSLIHI